MQMMSNTDIVVVEALPVSGHATYMTNAVPVRKHGKSRMTAKSLRKRCLNTGIKSCKTSCDGWGRLGYYKYRRVFESVIRDGVRPGSTAANKKDDVSHLHK